MERPDEDLDTSALYLGNGRRPRIGNRYTSVMLLIPAIDLKDGKCVRLRQGRRDETTVFSDDPVAVANRWAEAGAERLHVIDLDGAASGKPENMHLVEQIVKSLPDCPVQVGGGIRDEETVQAYLDVGVQYVILGTRAASQPHFINDLCLEFPGHVIVGIDIKENQIAISGWSKLLRHDPVDLARHFETDGVAAIIHTDVSRDGMMSGPNIEGTVKLASSIRIPVIAAGGYTTLDNVKAICATGEEGIRGVVLGRALYEGALDLAETRKLVDALCPPP